MTNDIKKQEYIKSLKHQIIKVEKEKVSFAD